MLRSEMIGPDWRLGRALDALRVTAWVGGCAMAFLVAVMVWFTTLDGYSGMAAVFLVLPIALGIVAVALAIAPVASAYAAYWYVQYRRVA